MNVLELKDKLGLRLCGGEDGLKNQVSGCYIGDLLSLAMAKLTKGNIWITIQTNINTIAVSSLDEAGCIILAEGLSPDENAKKKADAEGIPVLSSDKSAYEIAKQLCALGI